jgi:hypothetical protein
MGVYTDENPCNCDPGNVARRFFLVSSSYSLTHKSDIAWERRQLSKLGEASPWDVGYSSAVSSDNDRRPPFVAVQRSERQAERSKCCHGRCNGGRQ